MQFACFLHPDKVNMTLTLSRSVLENNEVLCFTMLQFSEKFREVERTKDSLSSSMKTLSRTSQIFKFLSYMPIFINSELHHEKNNLLSKIFSDHCTSLIRKSRAQWIQKVRLKFCTDSAVQELVKIANETNFLHNGFLQCPFRSIK